MTDKNLLGGKMMDAIQVGGKIYVAEEDMRLVVNAALATNEERNTRIAELERQLETCRAVTTLCCEKKTSAPPEALRKPTAWVATHESGALAHFSEEDGWKVEAVQTTPSPLVPSAPKWKYCAADQWRKCFECTGDSCKKFDPPQPQNDGGKDVG